MKSTENKWDKLLHIKTTGRDDSNADQYNYPYEPTAYEVLERLANSGYLGKKDLLVDYGCGKGRVDFYFGYQTKTHTIGIEYDERIYNMAVKNKETALVADRCEFVLDKAQNYEVPLEANRFYFFNPFYVDILKKVIARVLDSYYSKPRPMFLFFYYPSDEYISYLMTVDEFTFYDEIDCSDISGGESRRERIVIFSVE